MANQGAWTVTGSVYHFHCLVCDQQGSQGEDLCCRIHLMHACPSDTIRLEATLPLQLPLTDPT